MAIARGKCGLGKVANVDRERECRLLKDVAEGPYKNKDAEAD